MVSKIRRNSNTKVEDWLKDDNLLLIESWVRDGYKLKDIASKIGIDTQTLYRWKIEYPDIAEALSRGKELIDYKVENALLRSALGCKTKRTKITTTMRFGKVVETIKEEEECEQPPNVKAIEMYLYNRSNGKWRNMSGKSNFIDELEEDSKVEITVRRASNKNEEDLEAYEIDNKDIELRKRTKEEREEYKKEKIKEAEEANDEVDFEEEWPDEEDY